MVTNCSTSSTVIPWRRELRHQLVELAHDERSQAHRELVEQEDARIGDEGPRDGEHLLLAAGEGARHLTAPLLQPGEGLEGPLLDRLRVETTPVGPDAQVLADREVGEDPPALGDRAETRPGQLLGRGLADRPVADDAPRPRSGASAR